MTVQELIDSLTALDEPDLPVILHSEEHYFLKAEYIRVEENDYQHAWKDGHYILVGKGVYL
jgi:hypothetical protein